MYGYGEICIASTNKRRGRQRRGKEERKMKTGRPDFDGKGEKNQECTNTIKRRGLIALNEIDICGFAHVRKNTPLLTIMHSYCMGGEQSSARRECRVVKARAVYIYK